LYEDLVSKEWPLVVNRAPVL